MKNLLIKVKKFPKSPGVYLMKGVQGKVIYVGKAVNLNSRVQNYFGKGRDTRLQIDALMKSVKDIEYIVTDSEKEALLLEYNLIQENKPRYNILFKDSKSYVSLKITSGHNFPGIYVTRRTPKDGSTYFGPYTSSAACRNTKDLIIKSFQIRNCSDHFFANRSRPCIQHEIGRCTAPCAGLVTEKQYGSQVSSAIMLLRGQVGDVIKRLKADMAAASKDMRYEDAAQIRNRLTGIWATIEPQSISGHKGLDADYAGFYREGARGVFALLALRGGRITGFKTIYLTNLLDSDHSIWEQFLLTYYKETIQHIIYTTTPTGKLAATAELLTERRGKPVRLLHAQKGVHAKRLQMAFQNATERFKQKYNLDDWEVIKTSLSRKLGLSANLKSVECVDISNVSGKYAVGSIVSFEDGKPNKDSYRTYNIRLKDSPDDYAMMQEALSRRFYNSTLPDCILVDGGKGQMAIAEKVLRDLKIKISVVAMAKGKDRKQDLVFLPGRKNPIKFKQGERAYLFLKQIRDEAHRFGVKHYRNRHRKGMTRSELDDIAGIGPAKRRALLKRFGSVAGIKKATIEELMQVKGISNNLAKQIAAHITRGSARSSSACRRMS